MHHRGVADVTVFGWVERERERERVNAKLTFSSDCYLIEFLTRVKAYGFCR